MQESRDNASPDLSVLVVSHDSGSADLRLCLSSVRAEVQREGLAAELLLVDNASRDGAAAELLGEFPELRLLRNERNRGFGAAVNQGFGLARARRVLLLNPDAALQPGSLRPLFDALDSHPDVALAAPTLLLPDGRRQESPRRFYDLWAVLARRTAFGRSRAGRLAQAAHRMADYPHESPLPVDWVTGAAMLLDRDAFPSRGPFDERYFLYFEDVDLCRRLRAQGRTVLYEPRSRVSHRFARGSRLQRPWNPLLLHHLRSGLLYGLHWSERWWAQRWWRSAAVQFAGLLGRGGLLLLLGQALGLGALVPPLVLAALLLLPPSTAATVGRSPLPSPLGDLARLLLAGGVALSFSVATGSLAGATSSTLLAPLLGWALCAAFTLRALRMVRRWMLRGLRSQGLRHRATLIAGASEAALAVERALREEPHTGLEPQGFVPLNPLSLGGPTPRLPAWEHVATTAADLRAEVVLLAGTAEELSQMAAGVVALREAGVAVAFVLTGAEELLQPEVGARLGSLPLLPLGRGPESRVAMLWTGAVQRVIAAAGLVALAPAGGLLLALVALVFRGPPLIASPRLGRGERPFAMWRLRTGPGATPDRGGGRFGATLRRLHLDELPQLYNVLRAEMRLVGPRPVDRQLATQLRSWERGRFAVLPGITGMWQLDRLRRWRLGQMITSDLLYLLRWSPALDARILAETLLGRRNP